VAASGVAHIIGDDNHIMHRASNKTYISALPAEKASEKWQAEENNANILA